MKFTTLLSAATLAYAGSVAAQAHDHTDGTHEHSDSTSPSGESLPATGGAGDSTLPSSGGAASPATGDSDFVPSVSCRNNICYSAVVPSATVRSGSGPVWFQIYAPTTFSWVGMGTGTSMADSNMFLIYQDGNGNVTLSHRQASGRVPPTVPANDVVTMTLLEGSGVSDGFMVANFRCDNCTTWKQSESLDFTSEGTPMVGAWSEGDSLDSTDVEESIGKHTGSVRSFAFNLTAAQKSTAGNPFVGANAVPAEISGGGAANGTDEDGDDEGAASGRYAFLSTGVAAAMWPNV
ncbi:CBD9-like protein [Sarocladium strictum]